MTGSLKKKPGMGKDGGTNEAKSPKQSSAQPGKKKKRTTPVKKMAGY